MMKRNGLELINTLERNPTDLSAILNEDINNISKAESAEDK